MSRSNNIDKPELGQTPEAPPELPNPPYRCGVEQDKEGRIVRRLENMSDDRIVTEYAYDGASRLARVKVNGRISEEYRYDGKGRRSYARLPETSSGQAGRYPRGLSFKYRDGDRLGGVGLGIKLEYDYQGRTVHYHTGGPELAYSAVDIEYDDLPGPRGMQASIDLPTRLTYTETRLEALRQKKARFATDPRYQDKQAKSGRAESKRMETKVVVYAYDEDAMRRSKISETAAGRSATHYAWFDPFRLAAIRVPWSKTPVQFHYADNARLPYASTCQGTVLYLFYDHIGSLRAVANSNGHIVREIKYESFGHVVRDTNPGLHLGYGFAGGLHDQDTGFVRFWVRDYDPKLGRFLSPDPAWRVGLTSQKAENKARSKARKGETIVDPDRYGYSLDDPVNMSDPTGMKMEMGDYVFVNDKVPEALHRVHDNLVEAGYDPDRFTVRVTGGDRAFDMEGNIRSMSNGERIPNSSPRSPHLTDKGARAVDYAVSGASLEDVARAAEKASFQPDDHRHYADGHYHDSLRNVPDNWFIPNDVDRAAYYNGGRGNAADRYDHDEKK